MKFAVSAEVFEKLKSVCFGTVVAKNINNNGQNPGIDQVLAESVKLTEKEFAGLNVKEAAQILPYREAFVALDINPNKFLSSIEAMVSRVVKKKGFPNINPAVDLANAVSLKYMLPLGAHDLDLAHGDIMVKFSEGGEQFKPFGGEDAEILEAGELIYAVGNKVKTRRWIWRQSDEGKVTAESKNIFFPIDGFKGRNDDRVFQARDELAALLKKYFDCEVYVNFLDEGHRFTGI